MADLDDALTQAAETTGRPYGMTAHQVLLQAAIGSPRHPDAPPADCGTTDPRREARWCVLAPDHPGEGHNAYAPADGCRTWTAHEQHDPTCTLP